MKKSEIENVNEEIKEVKNKAKETKEAKEVKKEVKKEEKAELNESEKIEKLVEKAKKNGKITYSDLALQLGNASTDDMEKCLAALEKKWN